MHIAVAMEINQLLLPALKALQTSFEKKTNEFSKIIKIGRYFVFYFFVITNISKNVTIK